MTIERKYEGGKDYKSINDFLLKSEKIRTKASSTEKAIYHTSWGYDLMVQDKNTYDVRVIRQGTSTDMESISGWKLHVGIPKKHLKKAWDMLSQKLLSIEEEAGRAQVSVLKFLLDDKTPPPNERGKSLVVYFTPSQIENKEFVRNIVQVIEDTIQSITPRIPPERPELVGRGRIKGSDYVTYTYDRKKDAPNEHEPNIEKRTVNILNFEEEGKNPFKNMEIARNKSLPKSGGGICGIQ